MNGKTILAGLMAGMIAMLGAGPVAALGDRTPDEAERPGWTRPGDEIARGAGANPTQAAPVAEGPDVFHDAGDSVPTDWLWKARIVAVFADTPQDPAFLQQMRALELGVPALAARDAIVITDTDPAAASIWRRTLRPEGFSLVLVEKDGTVMLRKPVPWDMREIGRAIDRFPLRRQEMGRASVGP